MDTKFRAIVILICLSHLLPGQKTPSLTHLGLSKFISGDFDESIKFYSLAIQQDSTAYENFYFRGLTRAYLSDTSNCIADFINAIDLKKSHPHIQTDTLLNGALTSRPSRSSRVCSLSLDNQSDFFFQVWLATWLMLTDNKTDACKIFKQAEQGGIRQLKTYRHKYCH
jgi:hypothetical protein